MKWLLRGNRIYYLSVAAALLLWSTSFVGTKLAYSTFPPITLAACRFVIATAALGVLVAVRRQFVVPTKRDLGIISLSGLLGITLYFVMENLGVSMTSAGNASLIVASYPAVTVLLEFLIYRVPLTRGKVAGIAVAIAGVYLLSGVTGEAGSNPILGNLILVATGVVWAFYSFTTRKVVGWYPAAVLSFYQTAAGTVMLLPLALLERGRWQLPTPATLGVLCYLAILCSVAAFMLYNYGLRRLTAGSVVSLMNLVPIFGVIFSVLLLDEQITLRQVAGGVVVITGVLLSARQKRETQERPPASSERPVKQRS